MLRSLPTKTPSPNARSKLGRRKPRAKKSTLGFFSDKQQGILQIVCALSTSFSSACYLRTLVIAPIPMFFASRLIVAIMTAILTRCSLCVPRAGQHLSDHRSSERPDTLTAQTHHSSPVAVSIFPPLLWRRRDQRRMEYNSSQKRKPGSPFRESPASRFFRLRKTQNSKFLPSLPNR